MSRSRSPRSPSSARQLGRDPVHGDVAVGVEPPVLDELLVLVHPDVGLGVAGVDREQHRAIMEDARPAGR